MTDRMILITIQADRRTCTQKGGPTCRHFIYGTSTECDLFGEDLRVTGGTAEQAAEGVPGVKAFRCRPCLQAEESANLRWTVAASLSP